MESDAFYRRRATHVEQSSEYLALNNRRTESDLFVFDGDRSVGCLGNVGKRVNGANKAGQTKWRHSSGRVAPISTLRCKYCRVPVFLPPTTPPFAPFQLKQPTQPKNACIPRAPHTFSITLPSNDNCDSSKYLDRIARFFHRNPGRIFCCQHLPFLRHSQHPYNLLAVASTRQEFRVRLSRFEKTKRVSDSDTLSFQRNYELIVSRNIELRNENLYNFIHENNNSQYIIIICYTSRN